MSVVQKEKIFASWTVNNGSIIRRKLRGQKSQWNEWGLMGVGVGNGNGNPPAWASSGTNHKCKWGELPDLERAVSNTEQRPHLCCDPPRNSSVLEPPLFGDTQRTIKTVLILVILLGFSTKCKNIFLMKQIFLFKFLFKICKYFEIVKG